MSERLKPTDEDLAIVRRHMRRLQRWCQEAGQPINGRRAVKVAQNFVLDMSHFPPSDAP